MGQIDGGDALRVGQRRAAVGLRPATGEAGHLGVQGRIGGQGHGQRFHRHAESGNARQIDGGHDDKLVAQQLALGVDDGRHQVAGQLAAVDERIGVELGQHGLEVPRRAGHEVGRGHGVGGVGLDGLQYVQLAHQPGAEGDHFQSRAGLALGHRQSLIEFGQAQVVITVGRPGGRVQAATGPAAAEAAQYQHGAIGRMGGHAPG